MDISVEGIKLLVATIQAYIRCQVDAFVGYFVKDAKMRSTIAQYAYWGVLISLVILAALVFFWILRQLGIIGK